MQVEQQEQKRGLTATQKILIAGIAVLLIAVVAVGALIVTQMGGAKSDPSASSKPAAAGTVVIDDVNVEDTIAAMKERAKRGNFATKMNMTWTFPDGASPSPDAYVANDPANLGPFTFTVTMGGDGDGEVLYESPEVPLGSQIKDITLLKKLAAGSYDCVCTFHTTYEDENGETQDNGDVSFAITLIVKA